MKHKYKVYFKKKMLKGIFKGMEMDEEVLPFPNRSSAERWIHGIEKNCQDWTFAQMPRMSHIVYIKKEKEVIDQLEIETLRQRFNNG